MTEPQKARLYSKEEVRQILGVSRQDLRTIVAEVEPYLAPGDYDGQSWFSEAALRFVRAAHRWRQRDLSWEEIKKRFEQRQRDGLSPIPDDFGWAQEEEAAASEVADIRPVRDSRPAGTGADESQVMAKLDRIYREMKGADQRRREDIQALTLALGRLQKELELLRYQIVSMGSRRDRKRGWWTSQRQ